MRKFCRLRRGFTILEMSIVIVLIIFIAAIVLPRFSGTLGAGKEARARGDLHLFKVGIESLLLHENPDPLPANMTALLTALRNAKPRVVANADELYDPLAPAGNTRYGYFRNGQCYVVFSVGPDGDAEINSVTSNCRVQFAGVLDDIFVTNTDGTQGIV